MAIRVKSENSESRATLNDDMSDADTTDDESRAPSIPAVKREQDEEERKARAILKQMNHPQLKVKEEKEDDLPMLAKTVLALLNSIKPYTLSYDQKMHNDKAVSRDFMSKTFGGNTQDTFPRIRRETINEHGLANFMYLSKDYNPMTPTVPGTPGLFFSHDPFGLPNVNTTAKELQGAEFPEWAKVKQIVLTRLKSGQWIYVGKYKMSFCKAITVGEWNDEVPQKVRDTWAENTAQRDWGVVVRARILLRDELGRTPTVDEVKNKVMEGKVDKTKLKVVSQERVARAFRTGEEFILIWNMQCINYDDAFQSRLVTEFENWRKVPKPKLEETVSRRRARTLITDSDWDSDFEELSPRRKSNIGNKRKRGRSDSDDEWKPSRGVKGKRR
ncbi:hypothetical protein GYMLUDRAFT_67790 [Collybiopsis luxurians FD-317 M1]|nr:hypothetical protein GYMLUDRAFT_67790 [Collybiopsis luxurians FD-317 M1]